jgi:coenzyme F420-reducing hydrogenase beta subunit
MDQSPYPKEQYISQVSRHILSLHQHNKTLQAAQAMYFPKRVVLIGIPCQSLLAKGLEVKSSPIGHADNIELKYMIGR